MRVHSLTIQAIGPYADRQVVDVDSLSGAADGLFLIEGPTGSGKSTILDAITFALYGSLDEKRGGMRSTAAAQDDESFVELEFSCAGQHYRVRRTPEYERLKKRGSGTTTAKASVQLSRLDGSEWVPVSTAAKEVGIEIHGVLGLDREQFTQVALLPQGRFQRFLKSDGDKRRDVLMTLFGAELFKAVESWLKDQRTEAGRQVGIARQSVQDAVLVALSEARGAGWASEAKAAGAATEANAEGHGSVGAADHVAAAEDADAEDVSGELTLEAQAAAWAALSRDDLTGELDSAASWLNARAHAAVAAQERAASALAAAAEAHHLAAARSEAAQKVHVAAAEFQAHAAGEPEHQARAQRLALAQAAATVAASLHAVDRAGEARSLAAAELAGTESVDGLPDDASEADYAACAEAQTKATAGLESALADEATAGTAQAEVEALKAEADGLSARLADLDQSLAELPVALEAARAAAVREPELQQLLAAADARLAAAEALPAAQQELSRLIGEFDESTQAVDKAAGQLRTLVDKFDRDSAARLAVDLVPGEPCAVCGSVDHPRPAEGSGELADAAGVREAQEAERVARDAKEAADRRLQEQHRLVRELEGTVEGDSLEELRVRQSGLAAELAELESTHPGATASERVEELLARQQESQVERDRVGAEHAAAAAQVQAASESVAQLLGQLETARAGYPSVAARVEALAALKGAAVARGAARRALDQAEAQLAVASAQASAQAAKSGFDSPELARGALMDAGEIADLTSEVSAWDTRFEVLQSRVQGEDAQALDDLDELARILEQADASLAAAKAAAVTADQAVALAQRAAQAFAAARSNVEAKSDELEQVIGRTEAAQTLGDLATGNSTGLRRMSLTAYVLRRWFAEVVEQANLRLHDISQGRYSLQLTAETDSVQRTDAKTGLNLAVRDAWDNAERSPSSLSGGETFYTSLALALGLADVVQGQAGGKSLEMLFIDEGFDSLDSETLDTVMDVVERLREGGRAVGIISHVESLKERVPSRIMVRRRDDGTSTVTASERAPG